MRNIRESWHNTAPVNIPPKPTPMAERTTVEGGRVGEGVALGECEREVVMDEVTDMDGVCDGVKLEVSEREGVIEEEGVTD